MSGEYGYKRHVCVVWRPRHGNYNTFKAVKLALGYISYCFYPLSFVSNFGKIDKISKFPGLNCHDDLKARKLLAPTQINIPDNLPALIFKDNEVFFHRGSITQNDYSVRN
jgi:hypothetical protein